MRQIHRAPQAVVEVLIPQKRYERLVKNGDFSFDIIRRFAESQIVAEHIVNGRPVQEYTIGAAENA